MEKENWESAQTWHQLFDMLCVRAGHYDNASLASAYCTRIGRNGRDNFEAIQKNLRNWRLGRHLPLRRNVVVLASLLGVDDDPLLRKKWQALYAAARHEASTEASESQADDAADIVTADLKARTGAIVPDLVPARPWIALGGTTILALGFTLYILFGGQDRVHLPMIGYDARVKMVVGESRLIHGDRGDCDGPPPDWYYTLPRVPVSSLGTFSDGGLARKLSNDCNAVTTVRAVRFTATSPGAEEIELLDDYMKIVVTDVGNPRPE